MIFENIPDTKFYEGMRDLKKIMSLSLTEVPFLRPPPQEGSSRMMVQIKVQFVLIVLRNLITCASSSLSIFVETFSEKDEDVPPSLN